MARASATPIRAIAFLLLFLFLALGFHTRTEALLLAWIVGLVVLLLPKSIHKLIRLCGANRNLVVVVFSLFTVISAFLFVGYDVKDKIINTINTIYLSDGNQGAIRANLITNGLKSLSESPVVGLGPGSFSGDFGPFENREVHVTPLDWATQTGSIGLVLLIFLIGLSLYKAWISNRIELLAGMASLIVFAQFHYILRQPIVWVFVVYLITLTPNPHTKHSKQQI
jgi:hypothetical protein